MKKQLIDYAASYNNPPKVFRSIDVAFQYMDWLKQTGRKDIKESEKLFFELTGEKRS